MSKINWWSALTFFGSAGMLAFSVAALLGWTAVSWGFVVYAWVALGCSVLSMFFPQKENAASAGRAEKYVRRTAEFSCVLALVSLGNFAAACALVVSLLIEVSEAKVTAKIVQEE